LDATNAIHELDGTTAPSELENSTSAVADPKRPSSIVSELEGSPVTPSDPNKRASMATSLNQRRSSNASSLAPPRVNRKVAARPSNAEALSIVSQQHHGSGQDVFLTPPRPHASHRLSRPTSGLLPEIETSDDGIPSTPKLNTVAASEQGENAKEESHEGEQTIAVQSSSPISATADTIGENAGQSANVGESSHEGETTSECEVSSKIRVDAQEAEEVQAGEIASGAEAAHSSDDLQQSDVELQADEESRDNETARKSGKHAQSDK
jgi:hypothetical protein